MEVTEKSESSYYSLSYGDRHQVTHHIVAMEKVAEQHILTKSNTFQVINDLVMTTGILVLLKLFQKFIKK